MYFLPRRLHLFSSGRKDDARKLASKTHVDMVDHGIVGVPGAHRIISVLKTKSAVSALNLGHNQLGDDGCRELIHYLRSNISTIKIRTMNLNGCDLGNVSLHLIGNYIAQSPHLEELSLQNDRFQADPWVITKFTAALNQSNLRMIDFTGNTQLGDTFLAIFLANLRAPHLRELALSVLGLTPAAQQPLLAFLAAPPARPLKVLRLNGNALNRAFIDGLLATLAGAHNFSLVHVEVYSNRLNDNDPPPETGVGASSPAPAVSVQSLGGGAGLVMPSSFGSPHYSPPLVVSSSLPPAVPAVPTAHSSGPSPPPQATLPPAPAPAPPLPTWEESDSLLRALFQRNRLYATITSRHAVRLLPYARALFLRTSSTTPKSSQEFPAGTGTDTDTDTADTEQIRPDANTNTSTSTTILILPAELQIAILHHLVPVLSQAQCHRVCRYAADSTTILKFVLPSLFAPPPPTVEEAKQRWLETVHCDAFEPFDGWETVLRRELMAM